MVLPGHLFPTKVIGKRLVRLRSFWDTICKSFYGLVLVQMLGLFFTVVLMLLSQMIFRRHWRSQHGPTPKTEYSVKKFPKRSTLKPHS